MQGKVTEKKEHAKIEEVKKKIPATCLKGTLQPIYTAVLLVLVESPFLYN